MQGKLIVLEGTDGAGKSTQLELIKKHLDEKNLKYDFLHFPKYGHNEFSEVIAKFLRGEFGGVDDVNPYFVANIFAMDQFIYKPELEKKLKENDVVLLDRYAFSNVAFQGAKVDDDGKLQAWIEDLSWKFLELPFPDLTIFLDVPIEVAKKRLKSREGDDRDYLKGKQDIHEADLSFQSKVRNIYLSLKYAKNYHIIPCAKFVDGYGWDVAPPEEVFYRYTELLDNIL